MKKFLLYILLLIAGGMYVSSCSEDVNFGPTIYDTDTPALSSVDKWIRDNYVNPHNINIAYKWADIETEPDKNLVPAREDTIVSFLRVVKKGWIDTYISLTSQDIMNPIFPKQLLLIGSAAYNADGTRTLGTAEGGKKVVMYELDQFNPASAASVKAYLRVLHHEFCHILNQKKDYNIAFEQITPSSYTASWTNYRDNTARAAGFVTPYAMGSPGEDFAEMVAEYVTDTPEEWNSLLSGISGETGKTAILKKLDFVRTYMEESWNMKLDDLRDLVIRSMNEITEGNY